MVNIESPIMKRHTLIRKLSYDIVRVAKPHPVRVAIDGIDNAGKTTLADELGQELRRSGYHIIRASIDGFHRTREERYRRGHLSPEGYFYDSFNLDALKDNLLKPLGPAGNLCFTKEIFDFNKDMPTNRIVEKAHPDAILLFDGVFLLRPELISYWDFSVFLHITFKTALQRALKRDVKRFGNTQEAGKRYQKRYLPGQKLYLKTTNPMQNADIIVNNNDPTNPKIRAGTGTNL
jgi:uridine kinase